MPKAHTQAAWIAVFVVLTATVGCKSALPRVETPIPPTVVLDDSAAKGKRIGDQTKLVWKSDQAVAWEVLSMPSTWAIAFESAQELRISGRIEMGASDNGFVVSVRAKNLETNQSSVPSVSTITPRPLVFEQAPFVLEYQAPSGIVKGYLVSLDAPLPAWPDATVGRIDLWVDTQGLSRPGVNGRVPDTILIKNDEAPGVSWQQEVGGPCTTLGGSPEVGEEFSLRGAGAKSMITNGKFSVTVIDQFDPTPGCSDGKLGRIRLTFH